MSILDALRKQNSTLDDFAKLPDAMIFQLARTGKIAKEMVAPILSRKSEMNQASARDTALRSPAQQPTVLEKILASSAEQQMQPREMGVAQLPIREDMYDEQRMAAGGIVAFRDNEDQPVDQNMPATDTTNPYLEFNSPEYNRIYGAPGSLARKVQGIKAYYQSPMSWEGFKRNVSNTLNALGPLGAAEKVAAQPILGLSQKADIGLGVGRSALRANTFDTAYRASGASDLPEVISQAYYGTGKPKAAVPAKTVEKVTEKEVTAKKPAANSPTVDASGNVVPSTKTPPVKKEAAQVANAVTDVTGSSAVDEYVKILKQQGEDSAKARQEAKYMRLLEAGLGIMGGTSQYALTNIGQGAMGAAKGFAEDVKGFRAEERERAKTLGALGMEKEKLAITKQHYDNLYKLGLEENQIRKVIATKTPDQIRLIERYMSDPTFAKAFAEMSADKKMTALDQIITNAQAKGKPLNRESILAEVDAFLKKQ